jgi:hypothetical protein
MGAPKNRSYKRSWKNYLLDSSYQLRFTLFMVLVATALMLPLGWWVSVVARSQTEVARNQLAGKECPSIPVDRTYQWIGMRAEKTDAGLRVSGVDEGSPAALAGLVVGGWVAEVDGDAVTDETGLSRLIRARKNRELVRLTLRDKPDSKESRSVDVALPAPLQIPPPTKDEAPEDDKVAPEESGSGEPEEADTGENAGAAAAGGDEAGERPRAKIEVSIDDSELRSIPVAVEPVPTVSEADIASARAKRSSCLTSVAAKREKIDDREGLIMLVLVCAGTLLVIGLALYGIKMTHKVAGPLYKVGLYLAKLENEKYDTVYNLRKGDQLVEFYEHFKAAHAGLTKMQQEDRDRLREAVALANEADLASKSEELGKLLTELETMLAKKEESLGE